MNARPSLSLLAFALAALRLPASPALSTVETTGRSMLPAIPEHGARLTLDTDPAGFDRARKGDVIVWHHSKCGSVCHRVIARLPDGSLWTKGDNNALPDNETVTRENFTGIIVSSLPPARLPLLARGRRQRKRQQGRTDNERAARADE